MQFLSPTIKEALYFSAEKHHGQFRKGGMVPYIVHPVLVAFGVSNYTLDDEIVAAALLHDVLEDCPDVSKETIEKRFGSRIARLVEEVSFLEPEAAVLPWRDKKGLYLEQIAHLSKDAYIIISADKMTNMKAYFETLSSDPAKVKALFKATAEDYRWYYAKVGQIIRDNLGDVLIVKDYFSLLETI